MTQKPAPTRTKLFRALHALGINRGIDHDTLRDICIEQFGVRSMGEMTERQLSTLYKRWIGSNPSRSTPLPPRGYARGSDVEMISAEDIETLGNAFALRGWGEETRRAFIRRQLGRDQVRTRRDFWKVFSGVRAMNRRDGLPEKRPRNDEADAAH